jgi:hypothetical protein
MTNAMATTVSRRRWLSRLLMAAAVAPVLGVTLGETANADKKGKKRKSIKERADAYRRACVADGGTATVEKRPGGTTVTCTGGTNGLGEEVDWTCTVHSKGSRCHTNLTHSPAPLAGGGGAVPPSGGTEDPTDTGANPGGGGGVDPGPGADPTGGGPGDPVLE